MDNYHIQKMTAPDLSIAIDWAEKEGWEPGLYDAALFFKADAHGFFKGVINNDVIATGSAVLYDASFAFFGLYIVRPDYRGRGYGLLLTQARHAYCGERNIGLDGVLDKVDVYQRLGFKSYYENARYCLKNAIKTPKNTAIIPLASLPFETIAAFDRAHFPASRDKFLKAWVDQPDSLSLGFYEDEILKGYGVIRACQKAYKIGPLFAETPEIAEALFRQLAMVANGAPVYLDRPEINAAACALVKEFKMEKVFATMRMYTKEKPILKDDQIYGITTFELG
jgi:GNAT superfamily N-acetyltransferase